MSKKTLAAVPVKEAAPKKEQETGNRQVTVADLPVLKASAYDIRNEIVRLNAILAQVEAKIKELSDSTK